MALDIVSGLTGTPEGVERLKARGDAALSALLRLVAGSDAESSRGALTCLVNLSQDTDLGQKLVELNVVGRVMDYIKDKSCAHVGLLIMLLANVTTSDKGSEAMLQVRGWRRRPERP